MKKLNKITSILLIQTILAGNLNVVMAAGRNTLSPQIVLSNPVLKNSFVPSVDVFGKTLNLNRRLMDLVHKAKPEDAKAIELLSRRLLEERVMEEDDILTENRIARFSEDTENHLILVCEEKNKICGFIYSSISGYEAVIEQWAISRSSENKGYAKAIFIAMLMELEKRDIKYIEMIPTNPKTRRMVENSGLFTHKGELRYVMDRGDEIPGKTGKTGSSPHHKKILKSEIRSHLKKAGWDVKKASKKIGISRTEIYRRIPIAEIQKMRKKEKEKQKQEEKNRMIEVISLFGAYAGGYAKSAAVLGMNKRTFGSYLKKYRISFDEIKRNATVRVLEYTHGSFTEAAEILSVDRKMLSSNYKEERKKIIRNKERKTKVKNIGMMAESLKAAGGFDGGKYGDPEIKKQSLRIKVIDNTVLKHGFAKKTVYNWMKKYSFFDIPNEYLKIYIIAYNFMLIDDFIRELEWEVLEMLRSSYHNQDKGTLGPAVKKFFSNNHAELLLQKENLFKSLVDLIDDPSILKGVILELVKYGELLEDLQIMLNAESLEDNFSVKKINEILHRVDRFKAAQAANPLWRSENDFSRRLEKGDSEDSNPHIPEKKLEIKNGYKIEKIKLSNEALDKIIEEGIKEADRFFPNIYTPMPERPLTADKEQVLHERQEAQKQFPIVNGHPFGLKEYIKVIPVEGLFRRSGQLAHIGFGNSYGRTVIYLDLVLFIAHFKSNVPSYKADEEFVKLAEEASVPVLNNALKKIALLKQRIESLQIKNVRTIADLRGQLRLYPEDTLKLMRPIEAEANQTPGCDISQVYKEILKRVKIETKEIEQLGKAYPLDASGYTSLDFGVPGSSAVEGMAAPKKKKYQKKKALEEDFDAELSDLSVEELIIKAKQAMPFCKDPHPDWNKFEQIVKELKTKDWVDAAIVEDEIDQTWFHPRYHMDGLTQKQADFLRDTVENVGQHVENGTALIIRQKFNEHTKITVIDNGEGFIDRRNDRKGKIKEAIKFKMSYQAKKGYGGHYQNNGTALTHAVAVTDLAVVKQPKESALILPEISRSPYEWSTNHKIIFSTGNNREFQTEIIGFFYKDPRESGKKIAWRKALSERMERILKAEKIILEKFAKKVKDFPGKLNFIEQAI